MPFNCPDGMVDLDCTDCRKHYNGRCYSYDLSRPIIDILTDTERIARLEAVSPKPEPPARYDIQHLQAQINYLEKRLIKVEARKKRYVGY